MKNIIEVKEKAKKGDIESQFYLGRYYGDERYRDDEEAFYWLKLAADQGHQVSQMFVGYSYEVGEGVDKNIQLALTYYKMSALQNFFSGFLEFGQGKVIEISIKSVSSPKLKTLFLKSTNSEVANGSYIASIKYFDKKHNFLPPQLPNFGESNVVGPYDYGFFKDLFDEAIYSYK